MPTGIFAIGSLSTFCEQSSDHIPRIIDAITQHLEKTEQNGILGTTRKLKLEKAEETLKVLLRMDITKTMIAIFDHIMLNKEDIRAQLIDFLTRIYTMKDYFVAELIVGEIRRILVFLTSQELVDFLGLLTDIGADVETMSQLQTQWEAYGKPRYIEEAKVIEEDIRKTLQEQEGIERGTAQSEAVDEGNEMMKPAQESMVDVGEYTVAENSEDPNSFAVDEGPGSADDTPIEDHRQTSIEPSLVSKSVSAEQLAFTKDSVDFADSSALDDNTMTLGEMGNTNEPMNEKSTSIAPLHDISCEITNKDETMSINEICDSKSQTIERPMNVDETETAITNTDEILSIDDLQSLSHSSMTAPPEIGLMGLFNTIYKKAMDNIIDEGLDHFNETSRSSEEEEVKTSPPRSYVRPKNIQPLLLETSISSERIPEVYSSPPPNQITTSPPKSKQSPCTPHISSPPRSYVRATQLRTTNSPLSFTSSTKNTQVTDVNHEEETEEETPNSSREPLSTDFPVCSNAAESSFSPMKLRKVRSLTLRSGQKEGEDWTRNSGPPKSKSLSSIIPPQRKKKRVIKIQRWRSAPKEI